MPLVAGFLHCLLGCCTIKRKKRKSSWYIPALLRWLSLVEKSLNLMVYRQIESDPPRRQPFFSDGQLQRYYMPFRMGVHQIRRSGAKKHADEKDAAQDTSFRSLSLSHKSLLAHLRECMSRPSSHTTWLMLK